MPTVEALRRILGLVPRPVEGGYFVETYRSVEEIPAGGLPPRYGGARATPRSSSQATPGKAPA